MKDDFDKRPRSDTRFGDAMSLLYMAHGEGFVMVRYYACLPFCVTEQRWLSLPIWKDVEESKL